MSGKRPILTASGRKLDVLWSSVLTLTIVGVCQPAQPRNHAHNVLQVRPKIRLRIYNYAVSTALLRRSVSEAGAILNQAGLQVGWVDCPLRAEASLSFFACQNTMRGADFTIRILNARAARRIAVNSDALGQALECRGDHSGCSAYIFYRDVQQLTRDGEVSESELLGYALAHEIGHLLLGADSHSSAGIMRAYWGRQEFDGIARACLYFTDEQSRQMRAEATQLNSEQQNQARSEGQSFREVPSSNPEHSK